MNDEGGIMKVGGSKTDQAIARWVCLLEVYVGWKGGEGCALGSSWGG